jgi:glycosyltransferase involved in cell wall biosynthesis
VTPARIVLSHVYAWPEVRRGGERYLHELGAALQDAGHDVRIVSTAPAASRGTQLGVPVRYLRRRRAWPSRFGELADEVAFGAQMATRMAVSRCDVWHALGTSDAAAAAVLGAARGWRSVYTDLGTPDREYRRSRPDRRLHDVVVRRIDGYVCLSAAAAARLRVDYGREGVAVGGGVDTARFSPAPRRSATPAVLFTSAVDVPHKNLELLLEAVALLRASRPDVELWLSGPGDASATLERAPAAAREAVVDLGIGGDDDVVDLYRRTWVTAVPSGYEPFGLVVLESLACGTPVVALAEAEGPRELVSDGVGFRCATDAASLADACEKALDLAGAPGTVEACRAAAAAYDWRTAIVPRLEAVYGLV